MLVLSRHARARRAMSPKSSRAQSDAIVAIDLPLDADAIAIARATLSTNKVDARDVGEILRVARVATLAPAEVLGKTHAEVIASLTNAARVTNDAIAGRRLSEGDVASGTTPTHEVAAHAKARRALIDALAIARASASARGRIDAFERAIEVLDDVTERVANARSIASASGDDVDVDVDVERARDDDAERSMAYARELGASFAFAPSMSSSSLRGAMCVEDRKVGELAAYVPWNAMVGVEQALAAENTPLCECLRALPSLGEHVLMVIWLTAALGDERSPFARALAALPKKASTSLAWDREDVRVVFEDVRAFELSEYQRNVRKEYDALFPLLCDRAPEAFPREIFGDYSRYLLASDIWTAYAMKVQDPETLELHEVLVPGVYLCNHALHAHSVRYTALERGTKAFRLELARGVRRGEMITISYGRFDNADLVAHYGFSVSNNPYDCMYLTCGVTEAALDALQKISAAFEYDLTTLPPRFQRDASVDRALAQMRIMFSPEDNLARATQHADYHPLCVSDVDSEIVMLREIAANVKERLDGMRERAATLESAMASPSIAAIANATIEYRSGQMYIAQQVLEKLEALLTDYSSNRKRRTRDAEATG